MALTAKKLDKMEKSFETIMSGAPEEFAEIKKTFDSVRAAMAEGDVFTKSDLNALLSGADVEVDETIPVAKAGGTVEDEPHPVAPIMMELYKGLFDNGQIKKGLDAGTAQSLFEKAYQDVADMFDVGVNAAVEATAIEFGGTQPVAKKKPKPDCEDEDDMEKMLKGSPLGVAILKTLTTLGEKVSQLSSERDNAVFTKKAQEVGEPASMATAFAKLHALDPELADTITKALGRKNELLRKSSVWGEEIGAGGGGEAGGGAGDQINAKARDMVSKAAPGTLTFQKAYVQVCQTEPQLYAQCQEEQRQARR